MIVLAIYIYIFFFFWYAFSYSKKLIMHGSKSVLKLEIRNIEIGNEKYPNWKLIIRKVEIGN